MYKHIHNEQNYWCQDSSQNLTFDWTSLYQHSTQGELGNIPDPQGARHVVCIHKSTQELGRNIELIHYIHS